MKVQRLAIVLTVVNLLILTWILYHVVSTRTKTGVVDVLRGRGLEIIDDQGKRRAQIIVAPSTTMDGRKYPETVLLRLIDPNGRPAVKIGASVDGSGIGLAGDSERREWNGVQILAEETGTSLILTNKDGRKEVVKPQ
jgi:hypothetical protein